jgi:hypothetical protein
MAKEFAILVVDEITRVSADVDWCRNLSGTSHNMFVIQVPGRDIALPPVEGIKVFGS